MKRRSLLFLWRCSGVELCNRASWGREAILYLRTCTIQNGGYKTCSYYALESHVAGVNGQWEADIFGFIETKLGCKDWPGAGRPVFISGVLGLRVPQHIQAWMGLQEYSITSHLEWDTSGPYQPSARMGLQTCSPVSEICVCRWQRESVPLCATWGEVREHPSGAGVLLSLSGGLGIELRSNRMGSKHLNLRSHFSGPKIPQMSLAACTLYSKLLW